MIKKKINVENEKNENCMKVENENENKNEDENDNDSFAVKEIAENENKKEKESTEESKNKGGNGELKEENGENGKIEDDDTVFRIFWPFLITQNETDNATEYLSAINNSHIITQLIANYKVLLLGEERGLPISDKYLIFEIGNIVVPSMGTKNDGFEYYGKEDRPYHSVSTAMESEDENSENENESNDDIIYTKKTNKRRIANNKRRKQNKKNKIEQCEARKSENENNLVENNDDFKERKIRFNIDQNTSYENDKNSKNEKDDNNSNNRISLNDLDHDISALKNTDSDRTPNSAHSKQDFHEKKNFSTSNFREKRFSPVLKIRDIAVIDEKKKTLRVHEYYKKWKIYDLDVVY